MNMTETKTGASLNGTKKRIGYRSQKKHFAHPIRTLAMAGNEGTDDVAKKTRLDPITFRLEDCIPEASVAVSDCDTAKSTPEQPWRDGGLKWQNPLARAAKDTNTSEVKHWKHIYG